MTALWSTVPVQPTEMWFMKRLALPHREQAQPDQTQRETQDEEDQKSEHIWFLRVTGGSV